jgi:hypothetical protein
LFSLPRTEFNDPVEGSGVLMIGIVTQFEADIESDDDTAGESDGQTDDRQPGIRFVVLDVPASDLE